MISMWCECGAAFELGTVDSKWLSSDPLPNWLALTTPNDFMLASDREFFAAYVAGKLSPMQVLAYAATRLAYWQGTVIDGGDYSHIDFAEALTRDGLNLRWRHDDSYSKAHSEYHDRINWVAGDMVRSWCGFINDSVRGGAAILR